MVSSSPQVNLEMYLKSMQQVLNHLLKQAQSVRVRICRYFRYVDSTVYLGEVRTLLSNISLEDFQVLLDRVQGEVVPGDIVESEEQQYFTPPELLHTIELVNQIMETRQLLMKFTNAEITFLFGSLRRLQTSAAPISSALVELFPMVLGAVADSVETGNLRGATDGPLIARIREDLGTQARFRGDEDVALEKPVLLAVLLQSMMSPANVPLARHLCSTVAALTALEDRQLAWLVGNLELSQVLELHTQLLSIGSSSHIAQTFSASSSAAAGSQGNAGDQGGESLYRLSLEEPIQDRVVYRRSLKPAPAVLVTGNLSVWKRLGISVHAVSPVSKREIRSVLSGDGPIPVPFNGRVVFPKLKWLATSFQLKEGPLSLRFDLEIRPEGSTLSDPGTLLCSLTTAPITVISHTTQLRPTYMPISIPAVTDLIPESVLSSGGEPLLLIGTDFTNSESLRVFLDDIPVYTEFLTSKSLLITVPSLPEGVVSVRVANDGVTRTKTMVLLRVIEAPDSAASATHSDISDLGSSGALPVQGDGFDVVPFVDTLDIGRAVKRSRQE